MSPAFHQAQVCLLFDWDLTPANASALRRLLPAKYNTSLTKEQCRAIFEAVKTHHPSIPINYHYGLYAKPFETLNIPGQTVFRFGGLAYDLSWNSVYKYQVTIGANQLAITGEVLIQGPPTVGVHEFDTSSPPAGINATLPIDPEVAKVKKAQYELMKAFESTVTTAINSKPASE